MKGSPASQQSGSPVRNACCEILVDAHDMHYVTRHKWLRQAVPFTLSAAVAVALAVAMTAV